MDTLDGSNNSNNDAIARQWLDGELIGEYMGGRFSDPNDPVITAQGWTRFTLGSNSEMPTSHCKAVDYDDIAIYNTTPPNIDSEGNSYIGPLETEPDTTPPSHPQGLSVQ